MPFDVDALRSTKFRETQQLPWEAPRTSGLDVATDVLYDPLRDESLSITGKARRGVAGALMSVGSKLSDKLGGASLKSKGEKMAVTEESTAKARAALDKMNAREAVYYHREDFRWFLRQEDSTENLDCYEAIHAGMAPEALNATFFAEGAPRMINLPWQMRKDLVAGTLSPEDKSVDNELFVLMRDSFFRWRTHRETIRRMAVKIGG